MSVLPLHTKLVVPPPRPRLVPRARLHASLDEALHLGRKLILVSAPAGYGKTTLVASWCHEQQSAAPRPIDVAWLSLDGEDNDPVRFFTHLIAALQRARSEVGQAALAALHAARHTSPREALALLINDLAALSRPQVLVLDDYHLITAPAVHDALRFLLAHQPATLHLVLTTRRDPPLPLGRLRGRGELTELRAADLGFTVEESRTYFSQGDLPALEGCALEQLGAQIEGWALGMALARLALKSQHDLDSLIRNFKEHHYVAEFLAQEVLTQQPPELQTFLLQTAILEQLSAPLCDAVTGGSRGQAILEALVQQNLFTFPLDTTHTWFRYHPLFREFLLARLTRDSRSMLGELHRRAALWHRDHGLATDAVRHALAAPDPELAGATIAAVAEAVLARGEWHTLERWLEALPERLRETHPVLSIWYGQVLLIGRRFERAAQVFHAGALVPHLDAWLEAGKLSPKDHQAFNILVDLGQAEVAQARGDGESAFRHAQRAAARLPDYPHTMHAVVAQTLSVCHEQKNQTSEAARVLSDVLHESHAEDNAYVRLRTYGKVGRLLALQGQLRRARTLYEQGLREARAQNHLPLTGELQIGLGDLLREEDRLEEALELVEAGVERSVDLHQLGAILRGYVCLARIAEGRADEAAARAWLGRAQERVAGGGRPEHRRYVRAHRARLDARLGDVAAALIWAESCGLSPQSPLSPASEFEHLILARVLLAARRTSGLHAHLERLLAFAAQGRRTRRVVEILLLQTLLHHKRGDVAAAHSTLEEALALTGSEPYLRTFLDEGPLVLQLVRAVADEKESGHTAERIITAAARQALLIDPLSPREREVLALIAEGLTNRAIAERLYISFNTVIWHVRNLYRKLGVNNRTQAVARGRDLGLL